MLSKTNKDEIRISKFFDYLGQHYFVLYTIVFCAMSATVYLPFLIRGASFIGLSDGYNQYYPVLAYCGKFYRNLISNIIQGTNIPTYDFSIGFGDDIIGTLNWFGFGDVFSLLAMLVPVKYTEVLYTFLILLKLYVGGCAFSLFGKYWKLNPSGILLGSLVYVFSGYSFMYGMITQNFVNVLVTLPLFALSADRVIDPSTNTSFSKLLVLTTFIQSLSGFYFLYIELLFMVFYFTVRCFYIYKTHFLVYVKKICIYSANLLLGVIMAGVVFLPVLISYFSSARSQESTFSIASLVQLYSMQSVLERLDGLFTGPGYHSGLGICAVSFLCIVVMFSQKNKMKDIKVLLGLTLIGYWLPGVGVIMNGFSYSIDRWIFIIYFLIAYSTALIFQNLDKATNRHFIMMISALLIWITIDIYLYGLNLGSIIRIVVISSLFILIIKILYLWKMEVYSLMKFQIYMFTIALMSISCVALINNGPKVFGGKGWSAAFKGYGVYNEIMGSRFAGESLKVHNREFYRTDIGDTSINSALLTGTNSTSSYYSISNSNIYDFMKEYMISSGIKGSTFILQGLDGRKALEMILSVDSYWEGALNEEVSKNDVYLPLGFTYDSYIQMDDWNELDIVEKNDLLTRSVVLENHVRGIEEYDNRNREKNWDFISFTSSLEGIKKINNRLFTQENGKVCLSLNNEYEMDESEYYLYIKDFIYYGDKQYTDINIMGKSIRICPQNSYYGQQNDFLIKIPNKDNLLKEGKVIITFGEEGEYSIGEIEFRKLDASRYVNTMTSLSASILENVEIKENHIKGNVETNKNKILFMSIPYSEGWECKVDGQKVEVLKANIGFSAIIIPYGKHQVEWSYTTPGLHEGILLSVTGWSIFIILCILNNKRSKKLRL